MKRRSLHTFFLILPLLLACTAEAGTFGDKLRERIAERRAGQNSENGSASSGAAALPAGAKVISDVSYGNDSAEKMDIYQPANANNAPVIFMVHGGGWKHGDKDNNRVVDNKVNRWVSSGFIFISIDYPMLPEQDPLQQSRAVAKALIFAQQKAPSWGGDPASFILMGHSAGAHLVSLITAKAQQTIHDGAKPWLGTVSLDSAAMDVPAVMNKRHMKLYDEAFGTDQALWTAASPLHQLTAGSPPLLAVCSTERRDKPCLQAESYKRAAEKLNNKVQLLSQAKSHGEINYELGLDNDYTASVEQFMAGLSTKVAQQLERKN